MILKSSFISFAFIFCCFCGHAQKNNEEEIQEIEPVVITGQYKKTKQEKSVSKIKVINREFMIDRRLRPSVGYLIAVRS